jgi:uncharacterized protein (DUF2062 family)
LARYRLVIPVLRGKHSPEYTARGVMLGLLAAMTPTFGMKMLIISALWVLVRAVRPAWDFNLVVALAWTWVNNVFTAAPIYYLLLVTGRLMMGYWDGVAGYQQFQDQLASLLQIEAAWYEAIWLYVWRIFQVWGLPMFVGSIPWATVSGWLGYRWSLRLIREFRVRRARRIVAHMQAGRRQRQ